LAPATLRILVIMMRMLNQEGQPLL
jgi:hypothetical protein